MKRKVRIIGLLVAMFMLVTAMTGCGAPTESKATSTATPAAVQTTTPQAQENLFPLKEPITLTIDVTKPDKDSKFFEELPMTKKMEEETNVKIIWNVIMGDNKQIEEKKKIIYASGSYGDASNCLTDSDFLNYSAAGYIVPIESFINEKNTPNLTTLFEKIPNTKSVVTFPDNHIYTLPKYSGFKEGYVENRLWINKAWLDKLQLSVPKTTDELYNVLKAFKDNDPNGNGKPDEIPLTLVDENSFMHMESLMGMWGLAFKSGQFDSYITVKDGKATFAPLDPAFKEGMKFMNKLYADKLLDNEVFTQDQAAALAKIGSETDTVGLFVHKTNMAKNRDNYIPITPPKAEGYEVNWFVHPGVSGLRSKLAVTNHNKYPEITLAWFDKFYTTEYTYYAIYGMDSLVEENGMMKFKPIPEDMTEDKWYDKNSFSKTDWPSVVYDEDVNTKVELPPMQKELEKYMGQYDPYVTKTPWIRPLLTPDENERIVALRTDIFSAVKMMKSSLVVAKDENEFEAAWSKATTNLAKMHVDEYLKIQQGAYDRYYGK